MEGGNNGTPPGLPGFQVSWDEALPHDGLQNLGQNSFIIVEGVLLQYQKRALCDAFLVLIIAESILLRYQKQALLEASMLLINVERCSPVTS